MAGSVTAAQRGSLPRVRQLAGLAVALLALPLLMLLFGSFHTPNAIAIEVLCLQLYVVIVALVGGLWPALLAAVCSGVLLDLFFIEPHFTVAVADPIHLVVLMLHIATAVVVSVVLERHRREAAAKAIEPIAASDRVRGALLSALSHDLRRPLASATAAVGGLRAAGDALSPADRDELLETADESLASLTTLVTDLLDVSRVQAGVLAISPIALDPMDVIEPALEELGEVRPSVEVLAAHGRAKILADPVLLQRAIVNLLANALRFSPPETPVQIATRLIFDRLEIRVIDHGPGVPIARRSDVFVPFQRLGDTDNTTGLGLGLALSRGFIEAMQGTLEPEDTPGGGLTMVVSLLASGEGADTGTMARALRGNEGLSTERHPR